MRNLNVKTIECGDLARLMQQRPVEIIDVRTPEEFAEIRAAMARNLPLDALEPASVMRDRSSDPEEPLYFICKMGGRSAAACELFMAAGFPNVINVAGGTDAWVAAGWPTEQG